MMIDLDHVRIATSTRQQDRTASNGDGTGATGNVSIIPVWIRGIIFILAGCPESRGLTIGRTPTSIGAGKKTERALVLIQGDQLETSVIPKC